MNIHNLKYTYPMAALCMVEHVILLAILECKNIKKLFEACPEDRRYLVQFTSIIANFFNIRESYLIELALIDLSQEEWGHTPEKTDLFYLEGLCHKLEKVNITRGI